MFQTIKSKISIIIAFTLLLFSIATVIVILALYSSSKQNKNLACTNITKYHCSRINSNILRLSDFVKNFATTGETFLTLTNRDYNSLEKLVIKTFNANDSDISFGGGIFFEPYAISKNKKNFCSYAYNKVDGYILDSSFASEKYDYPNQMWYKYLKNTITVEKSYSFTKPYVDEAGTKDLMITLGSGIFDNNNNFIGIATADWILDAIIDRITKIKPTENSFVMFADKKNDSILVLNYKNENHKFIGKSLKEATWYNENLKNEDTFLLDGTKYISFFENLENNMIFILNVPVKELYYDLIQTVKYTTIFVIFAIIIILILLRHLLSANIEKPIDYILKKSVEFGNGKLDTKIEISKPKEFKTIAESFNNMAIDLKEYVIAKEHQKTIDGELKIARVIQNSILQKVFPPYTNRNDFDIFASMVPAKQVGGDFYDFFLVNDDIFVFLIADVSDKGIPAALFMMEAKNLIKNSLEISKKLEYAIDKANKILCSSNDAGFFVTTFIGAINTKTGTLKYINAGHNPPLLKKFYGEYSFLEISKNIPLGIDSSFSYIYKTIQLNNGDSLFLYTDGVTEAQNKQKTFYSENKLKELLNNKCYNYSKDIIKSVSTDVYKFCNGAEQYDDITMLNFIYHGYNQNSFNIEANLKSWQQVNDFLVQDMQNNKILKEKQLKILLACEEIFVNIASYAYDDNFGKVWITTKLENNEYTITFCDLGKPYNPLEKEDPNINATIEERKVGGLGIYLFKSLAKNISYKYENSKNILSISVSIN